MTRCEHPPDGVPGGATSSGAGQAVAASAVVRPLLVVALGGNLLCPPRGPLTFAREREEVARAAAELAALGRAIRRGVGASQGCRLLVVHGNGPQIGRLLVAPGLGDPAGLDIHVAQTQGELGYLLAEELERALDGEPCVAVVTRVLVDPRDPAFAAPDKAVGAVLTELPSRVAVRPTPDGRGWRRVVASPEPLAVLEEAAIRSLLATHHVVAGGGGGVPLAAGARHAGGAAGEEGALAPEPGRRRAASAVVDKDWVAALLAIALGARELVFVTDVPAAFDGFGCRDATRIAEMTAAEARARLARGVFAPGSMAPKVEAAARFVAATGRPATITTVGAVVAALAGEAGTAIRP